MREREGGSYLCGSNSWMFKTKEAGRGRPESRCEYSRMTAADVGVVRMKSTGCEGEVARTMLEVISVRE